MDVAKKGILERKTESLLIATQNNAVRTNYIKARIDKTQKYVGDVVIKMKRSIR